MIHESSRKISIFYLSLFLVLLLFFTQANAQGISEQTTIDFNGFGIASVKETIYVTDVEVLNPIGRLLYIDSISPSNVTYYVENSTIILVPPQGFSGLVEINYISQVANPSGNNWISNFTSYTNCTTILPLGAIPLNIEPLPKNFTITSDNRLAFDFPPGNISIVYTFSQNTTTFSSPQGGQTTSTPQSTPSTSYMLYIIVAIVLIAVLIAIFSMRKRFFRR